MSDRVTATVKVEFLMEFQTGPWGMECDLGQVIKQSRDDARRAVQKILSGTGGLLKSTKIHGPSIHMPEEEEV